MGWLQSRILAKWANGPCILLKGAILYNAAPNVHFSNYGLFYYKYRCIVTIHLYSDEAPTYTKFLLPNLITLENYIISTCTFFIFSSQTLNYGIVQFITLKKWSWAPIKILFS